MIKNIIFDFGDIFINLDKQIVFKEMKKHGIHDFLPRLTPLNEAFEVGSIGPDEFLNELHLHFPQVSPLEIKRIWNSMLLDFPEYRLQFLEDLAKQQDYRLFLLSNTNALHIPHVEQQMGKLQFERFRNCFEQFYLSHEIKLRKPNQEIFEFVLNENNLKASETFFIDDTLENTVAATPLGIKTWNLLVGKEDIISLKERL
ncbi:putative hydrolase of the HAD superfamily [Arenibacter nanhaiticus]|uniref:Putative hydrolase of the HAD superfamily n=1 Tax=Arenibacter nanhaiticus TaxID=558155 RepID=A0A1M6K509_9FLAO|nr:HAD-IA family hydrolase [Arenibacter nanhaiticus]SHJ54029.1 putative hydrolase of the HAD superfamily [Arenibacter nanhaiticus]